MLIEIGKDVVDKAYAGNEKALDILRDLAFAFRKCCHIVFTDRQSLQLIKELKGLSKEDKIVYDIIGAKTTTHKNFYNSFGFHAYVTFDKSTNMTANLAIINPNDVKNFEWHTKTQFLTENLRDAVFYEFVMAYYMRKSKINGFKKESEDIPGGGDTTVQYCESQIKNRNHFCLVIVDSDLKYKGGTLKETSSKVKSCIDSNSPFNCMYYIIEDLSEIENMIPFSFFSSLPIYKNQQMIRDGLQFCHDFFDFKKGLSTEGLINENFYTYWISEIGHLRNIATIIEDYRNKAVRCGCKEDYEKIKQVVLIDGFGDKLLTTVMNNKETTALLWKVTDADLSPTQRKVWYDMGQIIFEWCCAFRNYKNS